MIGAQSNCGETETMESTEWSAPKTTTEADARALGDPSSRPVVQFQPLRAIVALLLTVCAFGLYEFVLVSFWSSSMLGIHEPIPWLAFCALAAAMILGLAAIRTSLGIWSPHAKLGLAILAIFTCVVIGVGGGRFASYLVRGTLNPPFHLALARGDRFPAFALADQSGRIVRSSTALSRSSTVVFIYRGDFCPFARQELAELTAITPELRGAGAGVIAISADPVARSKILAGYLHTSIPLLSDDHETVLAPIGLIQRHRDGQPDSAIPAFFVLDRSGTVRWIFTSRYYRVLPSAAVLLRTVRAVTQSASN